MSDKRPPYHRRPTRPRPRAELAPIAAAPTVEPPPETRPALEEVEAIARASEADAITQARCPLCVGGGMVAPEIAATFEELVTKAKEQA